MSSRLDEICERACAAVKALGDEPCPECGHKTLTLGYSPGSHVLISCEGLKKKAPCEFSRVAPLDAYHALAHIRSLFTAQEPPAKAPRRGEPRNLER